MNPHKLSAGIWAWPWPSPTCPSTSAWPRSWASAGWWWPSWRPTTHRGTHWSPVISWRGSTPSWRWPSSHWRATSDWTSTYRSYWRSRRENRSSSHFLTIHLCSINMLHCSLCFFGFVEFNVTMHLRKFWVKSVHWHVYVLDNPIDWEYFLNVVFVNISS
jgi:hypothetical protein